jgi:hypothetical protein
MWVTGRRAKEGTTSRRSPPARPNSGGVLSFLQSMAWGRGVEKRWTAATPLLQGGKLRWPHVLGRRRGLPHI